MKRYIYIGPIILIVIWEIITFFNLVDPFFLPSPLVTLRELVRLFADHIITIDILYSLRRIAIAFIIAACIGLPLGFILGTSERVYRSSEFIIDFFRSIAPLAIFPLFLIIFGITDVSKIAVASFSTIFIIIFTISNGILQTRKSRVLAARIMGATELQIFQSVLFWETLPHVLIGLRNALGWIFMIIIAAEMFVGTNHGLGHKIVDFQTTYNIAGVYASIIIIGVIGYVMNVVVVAIEKRMVHWVGK